MNSLTNLREAFLVFISLSFIALLNFGQWWESNQLSSEYTSWEMVRMLALSEHQLKKIETINTIYDFELSTIDFDVN